MTFQFQLDNLWSVKIEPDTDCVDEGGHARRVLVEISDQNGVCLSGLVKYDGCCDWNDIGIMHFCGRKDTEILTLVFDAAMKFMGVDPEAE